VRLGQPCEVQLDALPEGRFRCEVHRLVPTVDRSKATVTVKVRFIDKDPRVLPEMSAKVAFLSQPVPPDERKPLIAVPAAAVAKRENGSVLYVVREGAAVETPVQVGATIGDLVQVAGVAVGDRVVVKPLDRIRDRTHVTTSAK
jgi:HlyD family secretion protein